MNDCLRRLLIQYMLEECSYVHEDVAYLNMTHNKIVYDEGSGWISSYTETGQPNRN